MTDRIRDKVEAEGRDRNDVKIYAMLSVVVDETDEKAQADRTEGGVGSDVLALTALAPFRPRRWRGAILRHDSVIRMDVLDPRKRPVMADADAKQVDRVLWVEIRSEPRIAHRILFDRGHGMDERLMREQFV